MNTVPDVARLRDLRRRVDEVIHAFLSARRRELAAIHPAAVAPVDELGRLLAAGGQRIRPAFVYWGFRAAGGEDGPPIVSAAAALELLHTMALIHDDLMDGTETRRGVPASHVAVGPAAAILAGDLAAVLADQLLLDAGFPGPRLLGALARYHHMRVDMAAGQYLDIAGVGADPHRVAALKGGAYTVLGPLLVGMELAGGGSLVESGLRAYGEPLGRAFQLLDDHRDGDAPEGVTQLEAEALVRAAEAVLDPDVLGAQAADALGCLARLVGSS